MKIKHLSSKKLILLYIFAVFVLLLTFCICVSLGSVNLPISETVAVFLNKFFGIQGDFYPQTEQIVLYLRAPRVILAMLVGAALSVSGATMQGLIKNPLADGSVLGVTAGGTLGAVITIAVGFKLSFFQELTICAVAIVFSMVSLLFIISFAYAIDRNLSSNTIILSGIIFNMLISGVVSIISSFSGDKLRGIVFWQMGSFAGRSWNSVYVALVLLVSGIVITMCKAFELDAFSMGEEQAKYAGVDVKKTRLTLLFCVSILCGTSVALAGNIAFVGLIIPHLVRLAIGPLHIRLIPFSVIIGAVFLSLCDLLARTIISPVELPIGVVTSVAGSAAFIYIFYNSRKKRVE